jgi:NAD(P)-dependent dehydrogenase (short-subunit alcohol dehydrogenase family)
VTGPELATVDPKRQAAFASLSGDYNPLHADPVEARRTQFGGPVVHGVHVVLLGLQALDEPGPWGLVELDAQFRSAVLVGEAMALDITRSNGGRRGITVRSSGQVKAIITCQLRESDPTDGPAVDGIWGEPQTDHAGTPPAELTLDGLRSASGREPVWLDAASFTELFPCLATVASARDMAVLLATTRTIGMRAPGRWALFRRLTWVRDLTSAPADVHGAEPLVWSTVSIDPRLSLARLDLRDSMRSLQSEVIVRQPPPAQPELESVAASVGRAEFAGMRALVVGGSRGLGELASKILVAGGGRVLLTYRTGSADAATVVGQLGDTGQAVELDVVRPSGEAMAVISAYQPTHLLYFATPPISRRAPGTWDPETFARFLDVYVNGLSFLLSLVDQPGSLRGLLYPSSIYLEERPDGFAEYAAAKAAGEALCATWQHLRPRQRVVVPRLRPLVTDQTAARLTADTDANIAPLLAVIRKLTVEPDTAPS